MIGKGKVLIGISDRTTKAGIENLAKTLFNDGCIHEVVMVEVIPGRATMHLDTVLTMIDYDKFAYYQHAIHENTRSWSIRPSHSQGMSIHENVNFFRTLSRITGNKRVTMVPTGGSFFRSKQEQWNDAINLLTLSPGNVVCYSKNKNTIRNLIEHDIRVTLVPGDELGKGRGGPRCMSCPLIRSPL